MKRVGSEAVLGLGLCRPVLTLHLSQVQGSGTWNLSSHAPADRIQPKGQDFCLAPP